jgi:hypothetical protein
MGSAEAREFPAVRREGGVGALDPSLLDSEGVTIGRAFRDSEWTCHMTNVRRLM